MNYDWRKLLDRAVDGRQAQMTAIRRLLHRQPEPSGHEHQTSLYLYQTLGEEGFEVWMGPEGRGVVANPGPGRTDPQCPLFALRADIDALRIQDRKEVEYRSRKPGLMHACGHDAHTAMVFGALAALGDLGRAQALPWPVPVRGIFQPAEETSTGAKEMIAAGAVDGCAAILSLHVDPGRSVGRVGLRVGTLTANCVTLRIKIVGRGGHTARPHEASDPIAAAAQLINALYLYVPRVTDSQDAVVLGVGQIHSGDNPNVIPEELELAGTLRTLDRRVHRETIEHIRRLAHGIGQTTDTRIVVEFDRASPSVNNDAQIVALARQAAVDLLGAEGVELIERPSMGSEDFAYYLDRLPGAMIRLGAASLHGGGMPLHSPLFDIDERALAVGAKLLARTAVLWSDPRRNPLSGSPGLPV